ncbi:MAG: hypothetical protein HYW08_04340, partial [candidate division NC10 bacterium]|nr:hypothetical protein [candidate division NC10 bacterium]
SAATLPAPRPEAPTAYAERAQARALVCVAAEAERDQVLEDLKREGYAAHAAADAADAIERLRFTPYALVILREGFGSAAGDRNPVLEHLAEMGMATRRRMHVVLVSPEVRSHDASAAGAWTWSCTPTTCRTWQRRCSGPASRRSRCIGCSWNPCGPRARASRLAWPNSVQAGRMRILAQWLLALNLRVSAGYPALALGVCGCIRFPNQLLLDGGRVRV